jgi:hypothetical protein
MEETLRIRVFRVVAGTRNWPVEKLRGYMSLRDDGLGFDEDTIRGMTPALDALVKPFGQRIGSDEVLEQQTVCDLVHLVEDKVEEAKAKRAATVRERALRIVSKAAHTELKDRDWAIDLRKPPLQLDDNAIRALRDSLNALVARYGIQITITEDEIRGPKTLADLLNLVETEIADSPIF